MALLASTSTIMSNMSLTSTGAYAYSPYLVFYGAYSSTLEETYARIELVHSSSGFFSQFPTANVTFVVKSNNALKLRTYTDSQYAEAMLLGKISFIVGIVILASCFLFSLGRGKWIGNTMFFTLQLMYLSPIVLRFLTPMQANFGKMKMLLGYNDIKGWNVKSYPSYPTLHHFGYSIYYDFNWNFMITTQAFALLMYIIFAIVYFCFKRNCQKKGISDYHSAFKQSLPRKFLYFFRY